MRLSVLLVLLCQFLFFSCKKYKPADAAFFIRSGQANLSTNTITQGSGSNKITDFWLYVNGQFQGVYAVGNLMPIVPANSRAKITIFAGIKNNGIAQTRIPWQFYERYDMDTTVAETGKTITRNFTFKYNSATFFPWMENFDTQGFKIIKSSVSVSDFKVISDEESFEGRSLLLTTATPSSVVQVESSNSYTLPTGTSNVYLEFNYKCNAEFSVGLICDDNVTQRPVIYVNAQGTWNKLYVQLSDAVNTSPISTSYKVYFRMPKQDNIDEAKMYLDNIKLVYL